MKPSPPPHGGGVAAASPTPPSTHAAPYGAGVVSLSLSCRTLRALQALAVESSAAPFDAVRRPFDVRVGSLESGKKRAIFK